jgi:hypothetical protein
MCVFVFVKEFFYGQTFLSSDPHQTRRMKEEKRRITTRREYRQTSGHSSYFGSVEYESFCAMAANASFFFVKIEFKNEKTAAFPIMSSLLL